MEGNVRWGRSLAVVWWLAAQLGVTSAHAQHKSRADEADRTFQLGRALLARGATREACEAFAQSHELRPRHGTLLNLAVCLEQQGDRVAAFHRFEESLSAAISDGRADREQLARAHIEDLRTKLAWLSIELDAEANVADLRVSCDGVAIAKGTSSPIALEPGPHLVEASAPGRLPFEATIATVAGGAETLRIPALALLEQRASEPPTPLPAAPRSIAAPRPATAQPRLVAPTVEPDLQWRRSLSISLLAVGTAALSVGVFCGARAFVDADAVERLCVDRHCTTDASWSTAQRLEARARMEARVANVALPLGAVALGTSAYLLWTKPRQSRSAKDSASSLQFAPTASGHTVGTTFRGTW